MPDPRISKLAQVLISYSLDLQPREELCILSNPLAADLNTELYRNALQAGGHIVLLNSQPGVEHLHLELASMEQLDYVSPVHRLAFEHFDAILFVCATHNTRELAGIDSARKDRALRAETELFRILSERSARHELKWCTTVFPTPALAQEAGMNLGDYQDFVYRAGMLDRPDPVAAWQTEAHRQQEWIDQLGGRRMVHLNGPHVDLHFSIAGRRFLASAGNQNFPSGEIYTSPVEDSADGWVRFSYPALYADHQIEDVELWFENGRVVQERAGRNGRVLGAILDSDPGARTLGEWGIGTNYGIQRFTRHMLFDEKMGGTIHLALGSGFPLAGGRNRSTIHWDMLCDMTGAEIRVDGELFYLDGRFVA